ncbi:MAG: DUF1206 domain-containing protein [Nocardioidaceae bacterium]
MNVTARAGQAGREADDSEWMDHAVRVGLVSYGVVHLIIAYLAVRLALGDSGGQASSTGAFQQLREHTAGMITLYVVALGFVALVVWQAIEAGWGHREEEDGKRLRKRLVSGAKVVIYASLAFSAFSTASGSSSGGGGTDGYTATVMQMPGGTLIVGAVGLGIVVVAGFLGYRGWTEKFRSKLQSEGQSGREGRTYVLVGKVGYLAKAVAFTIVGLLFVWAAVTHDPQKSGGLDQALRELLQQPFGAVLLVVVGLGLACYGAFCFAWARHLDR